MMFFCILSKRVTRKVPKAQNKSIYIVFCAESDSGTPKAPRTPADLDFYILGVGFWGYLIGVHGNTMKYGGGVAFGRPAPIFGYGTKIRLLILIYV